MPYPFTRDVTGTDFGSRFYTSSTVVGSPAAASETVVAQITGIDGQLPVSKGVFLFGMAAFTVGTSGASAQLRLRTGTSAGAGTVIFNSGALTGGIAAGNLLCLDVQGVDTAATGGAAIGSTSYCLTLTIGSGAATSTVSAVSLILFVF